MYGNSFILLTACTCFCFDDARQREYAAPRDPIRPISARDEVFSGISKMADDGEFGSVFVELQSVFSTTLGPIGG